MNLNTATMLTLYTDLSKDYNDVKLVMRKDFDGQEFAFVELELKGTARLTIEPEHNIIRYSLLVEIGAMHKSRRISEYDILVAEIKLFIEQYNAISCNRLIRSREDMLNEYRAIGIDIFD